MKSQDHLETIAQIILKYFNVTRLPFIYTIKFDQ